MNMAEFVSFVKATSLSEAVRYYPWVWPVSETLHFIGLSLLLGAIGILDLRLIGFMKRVPVTTLRGLLPYGIAGFVINLVTGLVFFIGAPDQYLSNIAFYYKIGFLVLAGANALFFETTQGHRLLTLEAGGATPTAFRIAGAISILSWFMVLYWGRMLPFVGNAF